MSHLIYKHIPKSITPEGTIGNWSIQKFTISVNQASRYNFMDELRTLVDEESVPHRPVSPGNYTRLSYLNEKRPKTIMSDTPAETMDHFEVFYYAHGDVLINGLGIGLITRAILLKEEVNRVVTNELNKEVIELTGPALIREFGERCVINHVDAFKWSPKKGERFNIVWHDIWSEISDDNYKQMKKLHRRYGQFLKKPHWQGSWCREESKQMSKQLEMDIKALKQLNLKWICDLVS